MAERPEGGRTPAGGQWGWELAAPPLAGRESGNFPGLQLSEVVGFADIDRDGTLADEALGAGSIDGG